MLLFNCNRINSESHRKSDYSIYLWISTNTVDAKFSCALR